MLDEDPTHGEQDGEELLRRALLDESSSVAVSLKISGLPVSEAVTVIFHGRRDLGTLQTYVAYGSMGAGSRVAGSELLRVPCDLDLADAGDRDEAERLYAEQAKALRDALVGADTVLGVWREPLDELSDGGVSIDHSVELSVRLPAPRRMRRRYMLALVALGVVLFVAISVGLARVFGANGAEQSAITSLVKSEAAGDQQGMLALIDGCSASAGCRTRVAENAVDLKRPGA